MNIKWRNNNNLSDFLELQIESVIILNTMTKIKSPTDLKQIKAHNNSKIQNETNKAKIKWKLEQNKCLNKVL